MVDFNNHLRLSFPKPSVYPITFFVVRIIDEMFNIHLVQKALIDVFIKEKKCDGCQHSSNQRTSLHQGRKKRAQQVASLSL